MSFMWNCCALSEEPTPATDCDALGTMPGAEWTVTVDVDINGTMYGDGYNWNHRDCYGPCSGGATTCAPGAFQWRYTPWQGAPNDPTICDPDFCASEVTMVPGNITGDGFYIIDDSGVLVDSGGSDAITEIEWNACIPLDEIDPCHVSSSGSGDEWYCSVIYITYRWYSDLSASFENDDCTTFNDRSGQATNTWSCTYFKRLAVGEPVAAGAYKLLRVLWSVDTDCMTVKPDGTACGGTGAFGVTPPGDDTCLANLADTFDMGAVTTLWTPPPTVTVTRTA